MNYFDAKRDSSIINASGFFCSACLVGKPQSEASPDPRYCQVCYQFLLKKAEDTHFKAITPLLLLLTNNSTEGSFYPLDAVEWIKCN